MESSDTLIEEKKLMNEAKYRNYMSNIDKALKNFEYSSEWADLISALGKLSKAISSNTQYQIIPRRIKISKRLAQCMHPALPSGVHLKALETYGVIFSKTGPERLATELFIYSAGLFPLLGYAAMNVRPALLDIYEKYFVPLGEKLRPALSGFLSGVLPGYESGLDHFDRTNSLLMKICTAVGPMYFYSVLWECVTTNSSIRLPAISYLLDHFNKRLGMREQIYIMGYNHDIMLSGLCACLNDTVILVQRNTLEFLLLGFPMHTNYLNRDDVIKLVTNGLNTILRRDMSLNRRLYSWLLGTEVLKMSAEYIHEENDKNNQNESSSISSLSLKTTTAATATTTYFEKYSKEILIKALTCILQYSLESTPVDLKPYRILVSLLDKAEIGLAVLDYVLCDVIRTMSLSSGNLEVGKSANLLFATFDPVYIWNFMTVMYEKNCKKAEEEYNSSKQQSKNLRFKSSSLSSSSSNDITKFECVVGSGDPNLIEICYLTEFLLETISLEMYNETTRLYLPKVFLAIIRMLTIHSDCLSHDEVIASLKLCMKIVSRVQPMITSPVKVLNNEKRLSLSNTTNTTTATMATINDPMMMATNKNNNTNFTVSDVCNALEKSKSDSKLNQFIFDDEPMRRSNSNHNINKRSPKKTKKSKSHSKLLIELDKEPHSDTGQSNSFDSLPDKENNNLKKLKNKKINSNNSSSYTKLGANLKQNQEQELKNELQSLDNQQNHLNKENSVDNVLTIKPDSLNIQQLKDDNKTSKNQLINNVSFEKNTILEKCIKQYEIFYEVYLSCQILEIDTYLSNNNSSNQQQQSSPVCPVTLKINEIQSPLSSSSSSTSSSISSITTQPVSSQFTSNVFDKENIYDNGSNERLIEINKLFNTLQMNSINRLKHLHNLLNKSINKLIKTDSISDLSATNSDTEFKDCISSTEKLDNIDKSTATSNPMPINDYYYLDCHNNQQSQQQHPNNYNQYHQIKMQKCDENTEKVINKIMSMKLNHSQRESIKLASNLLVEMSTFPNCYKNLITDHREIEIPSWLKVLTIITCYAQNDKELQLSTITTLFDLISLLRSQIQHTTNPGVTFVIMIPLLKFGHVNYLENRTRVFHLLTSILWDYLDDNNKIKIDLSQITSLLYQLHNCLDSGLVETVIGNRMSNAHKQFIDDELIKSLENNGNDNNKDDMKLLKNYKLDRLSEIRMMCVPPSNIDFNDKYLNESESKSFKKFELLWHLGRDKQISSIKCFEKTLLRVLDVLSLPYNVSLRTFVTKWLQESLLRGDLSRLIKPLLNDILLTSNTKRVGIVHVHLIRKDGNNTINGIGGGIVEGNQSDTTLSRDIDDDTDTIIDREVYAISSEYGNIKYHMDTSHKQKRSPIRSLQKKFFGVTLGNKNKTSNFVSDKTTSTATIITTTTSAASPAVNSTTIENENNNNVNNIGVIVNPLLDLSSDIEIGETEINSLNGSLNNIDINGSNSSIGGKDNSNFLKDSRNSANDSNRNNSNGSGNQLSLRKLSSTSDDSDDSYTEETESEQRETSTEKDVLPLTTATGLKRFVGNCEQVSEALSEHDRAKNRKTYHLNQSNSITNNPPIVSTSNVNNNSTSNETLKIQSNLNNVSVEELSVHAADEYFNSSSDTIDTVENFLSNLLDQVETKCDTKLLSKDDENSMNKSTKILKSTTNDKKLRKKHNTSENNDKRKRTSCYSKTSTESNTSATNTLDRSLNENDIDASDLCDEDDDDDDDDVDVDDDGEAEDDSDDNEAEDIDDVDVVDDDDIDDDLNSDNENEVFDENTSISTKSAFEQPINDDQSLSSSLKAKDKRSSSLSTNNKINWELNKETLEKSKQNVEILRQNVAAAEGKKLFKRKTLDGKKRNYDKLHPYHTHMLLYYDVYDTKQTLYALQTLRNIISSDTRTFLCLSITTSIPNGSTLKNLLIRHRKSIFGKGFNGNIMNTEFSQQYRGCMYLEALVQICLYYGRSYFQYDTSSSNLKSNNKKIFKQPNFDDICGNCKVQLASVELLTLICTELIEIVKGMGKGLACYIADLMVKCKMQKIILHCINSSVLSFNNTTLFDELKYSSSSGTKIMTISEQILAFNYPNDENLHAESFQIQLLRLLMAIIKLEYEVHVLKSDDTTVTTASSTATTSATATATTSSSLSSASKTDNMGMNNTGNTNSPTRLTNVAAVNVKYLPNCLISQQPMFLASVLSALQADYLRHLHRNWTDLVTSSLSCFNFGSLTNIVISVVHQLCNNLDKISKLSLKEQTNFPPDYVVSQLEAITILCHYCLLDNTQQTTLSHLFNQAYPQTSVTVQSSNTGQLLNNIVHSFLSSSQNSNETSNQQNRNAQHLAARNAVLSHLSRIVATVASIWDSELGQIRQVKQQLMEFLSPISLHHGVNFLAAVAVTWQERGEIYKKEQQESMKMEMARKGSLSEYYMKNAIPQASPEQQSLVKLVSSIRVMPMDSFVQTLHQVVKSPPPVHRPPVGLTIEVSALELFYFYMKNAPAPQIGDSWSSLLALLRDGINLSPPAQFVLLMLLNEFVQKYPQLPFPDKKDLRDLHDITSRLIEALSNVAGACLEQTTWLRRNLAVKEDIAPTTPDGNAKDLTGNQQYCVQAQSVLAYALANLLDVAYGSQEKDKVVAILTTLLYNITPYLKNHTARNIPSFYACSHLLANLSGYQYTRKAWRKDMFDLFLDSSFFQMDISCLPYWKQILDNLMTYDNTTFRELMSRVSLAQTSGLSIFSSREQEYEQRAILLKRLAFVIYCSELDQYHKYMPEIQEQLVNSLRLPSVVPSIQAAVFLCFRVLLLRMSPDHVTSLWPIIIAEMVQVFLAMEQELKSDSDEISHQMRILSGLDVSWAITSGNGISSQNHLIHWRNVQLEASKLLEFGCVLPATLLPHFQMYRWAFVGTEFDATNDENILINGGHLDDLQLYFGAGYVPHIRRIARLMDLKYAVHSPKNEFKKGDHLVLTYQQITSLQDLYGFFSTLSVTCSAPRNFADTDKTIKILLNEIENVLASDFLEKMPTTSTTPR